MSDAVLTEPPSSPEATPAPPTFLELGADADIARALAETGIERAFPIQAMTLPLALEGRDLPVPAAASSRASAATSAAGSRVRCVAGPCAKVRTSRGA